MTDTTRRGTACNGTAARADQPALDVRHLTVVYEQIPALDAVSFRVAPGERVAVVGPNGAGKSTLLKTLAGLIRPTAGTIQVGRHLHTRCSDVAYVPQRAQVDWSFPIRVWDVVMLGRLTHMGWFRGPGRHDRVQVQRSLEQVRLHDLAHRHIGALSGGQQQRVFLARALAQEASVLLLDEPMTGLDIPAQDEVLRSVDAIHQQGVTVLVATHDLQQAADPRAYERVLLLNRHLIGAGPPQDVLTADHLVAAYGGQIHRVDPAHGVVLLHD